MITALRLCNPVAPELVSVVADALGVDDLSSLHEGSRYDLLTRSTDQATHWHRAAYPVLESDRFRHPYLAVVRQVRRMVGGPIVYQRVPTFRVHLPGNVAVGEWHTDAEYAHSVHELNVWVPLTEAKDTAAVWIETAPGSGSYRSLDAAVGEFWVCDTANLRHGNKPNASGSTRVSFDFRVIPLDLYEHSSRSSINTALPMRLPDFDGERTYFEAMG